MLGGRRHRGPSSAWGGPAATDKSHRPVPADQAADACFGAWGPRHKRRQQGAQAGVSAHHRWQDPGNALPLVTSHAGLGYTQKKLAIKLLREADERQLLVVGKDIQSLLQHITLYTQCMWSLCCFLQEPTSGAGSQKQAAYLCKVLRLMGQTQSHHCHEGTLCIPGLSLKRSYLGVFAATRDSPIKAVHVCSALYNFPKCSCRLAMGGTIFSYVPFRIIG